MSWERDFAVILMLLWEKSWWFDDLEHDDWN
jgi:hypothetical protein